MDSTDSLKERRDIFSRPRQLTRSEIASLRQDAISTSMEMKEMIAQRGSRQRQSMRKLMAAPLRLAAE